MKFTIDQSTFSKTLQKVQGIVERRNTMPILANVLIESGDGTIDVTATDLEVGMRVRVPARVDEHGRTTVPAKKLFEIIKELPASEEIRVTLTGNERLEIVSGRARFSIVGLRADDYPHFPVVYGTSLTPVDAQTLLRMMELTSFAICTDDTKYNLSGLFLCIKEGEQMKLRVVATDGHRLSMVEEPIVGTFPREFHQGMIIPRKGVSELRKLCDETGEDILIGLQDNSILTCREDTMVVTRLVNGTFPDYERVIPKQNDKIVTMDREGILHTLRRMSILSSEKVKGVKFDLQEGKVVVSSSNPDFGEAVEELDVRYDGPEMTVRLNARYLIDALSVMKGEQIEIDLRDEMTPVILRETTGSEFLSVIMPMRM